MSQLPPVPPALRALAHRQLNNEKLAPYAAGIENIPRRSVYEWLTQMARLHRTMQQVMLDRQKQIHPLTQAPNHNPGEWSRLLAEFDRSIQALRIAYRSYLGAEPEVARVLEEWRQQQNPTGELVRENDVAVILYLKPAIEKALAPAQAEVKKVIGANEVAGLWIEATTRYLQLLGAIPAQANAA